MADMLSLIHISRLKDVTIFFLEVRQSNEAAKRLYEKLGYSPIEMCIRDRLL